ncbi:MAG: OprO/OprP family phosphate-selective porin [Planctomycetota bacterium]|jgi:phosphate-selective porin OprO/OprP
MAVPVRLAALILGTLLAGLASAEERAANVSLDREVERYVEIAQPDGGVTPLEAQWKTGPSWISADGAFKVALRGRLHLDWYWQASDEFGPAVTEDGVLVRRARIGVEGYAYRNLIYKLKIDFAVADVVIVDVFMGLRNLPLAERLLVGHFKRPFSLSAMESSNYFSFLDRPPSVNAFLQLRDLGIATATTWFDKRLRLAMGYFKQTNQAGTETEGDGYSFAARFTGLPIRERPQGHILHLGVSFSYTSPAFGTTQFDTDVTTGDNPALIDTGSFQADKYYEVSFELAWILKSFAVQGEYHLIRVDGTSSGDPDFFGWYVEVSYWLTGEKRKYQDVAASFGRVLPKRNFFDGEGGWGAWQIAYRIDHTDLNSGFITGGAMTSHTIGVNWHWNPNTRVLFNFIFADVESGPEGAGKLQVFETRFQIDW